MSSETEEVAVLGEEGNQPEGKGGEAVPSAAAGTRDTEVPANLAENGGAAPANPVIALEAEVAKWKDLALRSQAELDNFRKRMAREKADAIRLANAGLLEGLLPVVDNFHFGLEAARQEAGLSVVFQGMSMVLKQLNDLLLDFGAQEVPAEGQRFDPNVHEAVKEEPSDQVAEGHVISVIRKGFRLHDRLLRAASVIVSRGPEAQGEPGTAPEPARPAGPASSE